LAQKGITTLAKTRQASLGTELAQLKY